MISKSRAEKLAGGNALRSKRYAELPKSPVIPRKCWGKAGYVVCQRKRTGKGYDIAVVTNDGKVRRGVGPPSSVSYSYTGPVDTCPDNEGWWPWRDNAAKWFKKLGLGKITADWPSVNQVINKLKDKSVAAIYWIAHGDERAHLVCSEGYGDRCRLQFMDARKVKAAMKGKPKMPFSFLASCDALESNKPGTFAHELTHGLTRNCAVVGLVNVGDPGNFEAWIYAYQWQDAFFKFMQNCPVCMAYNLAGKVVPQSKPIYRFYGDPGFGGPYERTFVNLWLEDLGDSNTLMADIDPCSVPFYPFVRVVTRRGELLYWKANSKLWFPTPCIGGGPFIWRVPRYNCKIVTVKKSAIPKSVVAVEAGLVNAVETKAARKLVYLGAVSRVEIK